MLKNRLFNLLIAIALFIVVALTVGEALATTIITSQPDAVPECNRLPSRLSIHTEIVKETGMRFTYTEDGPTGLDGGLMDLLSKYRTCSR